MKHTKAMKKLVSARVALVLDSPFFGSLSLRLNMREDLSCPTMYTDGSIIGYNPDVVEKWSPAEIQGVLCHEILHVASGHVWRRDCRDMKKWNMACVKPGTIIPGDYETIDTLNTGSMVFGMSGVPVKVTRTYERPFKGDMVRIKSAFLPPIEITPNHKMYVVPFKMKSIKNKTWGTGKKIFGEPVWVAAKDIGRFHMMVIPKLKGRFDITELPLTGFIKKVVDRTGRNQGMAHNARIKTLPLNTETAWMMGVYVAEGSAGSYDKNFKFSLGRDKDEAVRDRLVELFRNLGYSPGVVETDCDSRISVIIPSSILMRAFKQWFGRGAHNKKIPDWILLHNDEEIIRSFLWGYLAGDGCVYNNKSDSISFDTVSEKLALQVQIMIARFAGMVTFQKKLQPERAIRGQKLCPSWIFKMQSRNRRVLEFLGVTSRSNDRRVFAHDMGGCWLVRVRNVKAVPYEGMVYNVETEDHSYLVGNSVVHNCDYAINPIIIDADMVLPKGTLMDSKYKGLPAERIYTMLPDDTEGEKDNNKDGSSPAEGDFGPGSVRDNPGSEEKITQSRCDWVVAVRQAAQSAKAMGKLPGSLEGMVQEMLRPKGDWRALLRRFVQETARADYSWKIPNRRYVAAGLYLPSLRSEQMPPIVVAVDSSGSIIQGEMDRFASEINAIVRETRPETTHVVYCDSRIQNNEEFLPNEDIVLKPKGGGGTAFSPVFSWVDKEGIEPACLIYLTDGYGQFEGVPPDYPVLWALTSDIKPPFGEFVNINET